MSGVGKGGRYPAELRERAMRMVFEHQDEYPTRRTARAPQSTRCSGREASAVRTR